MTGRYDTDPDDMDSASRGLDVESVVEVDADLDLDNLDTLDTSEPRLFMVAARNLPPAKHENQTFRNKTSTLVS